MPPPQGWGAGLQLESFDNHTKSNVNAIGELKELTVKYDKVGRLDGGGASLAVHP